MVYVDLDGWEVVCERVVKVTKIECKMAGRNPRFGWLTMYFCKNVKFVMHDLMVLIEKTYRKVLYFSIDKRGKRC